MAGPVLGMGEKVNKNSIIWSLVGERRRTQQVSSSRCKMQDISGALKETESRIARKEGS